MKTFCTILTNKDLNIRYEGPLLSKADRDDAEVFVLNMNFYLNQAGANVRIDLDGEFIEAIYEN